MKNFIIVLMLTAGVCTVLVLNSCKKETTSAPVDNTVSAQDNATILKAMDATSDDAGAVAGQAPAGSERPASSAAPILCGVSIIDTGSAGHRIITITYDGSGRCSGIIRSGTITIDDTSGLLWNQAGDIITVTYNTLKITDVITGNTYTVDGHLTVTKETAGVIWRVMAGLATNTTVAVRSTGSMVVTFPNGKQAQWKLDRSRSWTSALSGKQNLITTAVYAEGPGNVDLNGNDRYGEIVTHVISQAIMANNNPSCPWNPYQGEVIETKDRSTNKIVYGTNPAGVQIGSATVCGNGYYITSTINGINPVSRFVGYP